MVVSLQGFGPVLVQPRDRQLDEDGVPLVEAAEDLAGQALRAFALAGVLGRDGQDGQAVLELEDARRAGRRRSPCEAQCGSGRGRMDSCPVSVAKA